MSFWAGIILENQALLLIDRYDVDMGERKFFKSIIFRKVLHEKFLQLGPKTFLLPGGSLFAAAEIGKFIREHFGDDPIQFGSLLTFQKEFKAMGQKVWGKVQKTYSEGTKRIGVGVPNLDCLLGFVTSSGRPYLVNFNDANNFDFYIKESPSQWEILNMGPLNSEIGKWIRKFEAMARGKPAEEQRVIARSELGSLIPWISRKNQFVSPIFDMIFIGDSGQQIKEMMMHKIERQLYDE